MIWLSFIFVQRKWMLWNFLRIIFVFFIKKPKKRRKFLYISFYWLYDFLIQRHTKTRTHKDQPKKENENLIRKKKRKRFFFPYFSFFYSQLAVKKFYNELGFLHILKKFVCVCFSSSSSFLLFSRLNWLWCWKRRDDAGLLL